MRALKLQRLYGCFDFGDFYDVTVNTKVMSIKMQPGVHFFAQFQAVRPEEQAGA
jgi:hypothetical protein